MNCQEINCGNNTILVITVRTFHFVK